MPSDRGRFLTSLRRFNHSYLEQPLWLRLLISAVIFIAIVVATQSVQVFPGALMALFNDPNRDPSTLPEGVEGTFLTTADGERLELWKLPAQGRKEIAIIFHGNAGDLANFYVYQLFFNRLGISSYAFDYRGFGKSSGWPSEVGIYEDSRTVIEHVLANEPVTKNDLILVGVSIGTGPAAYAAEKYDPKALILFSPFESFAEAVKVVPFFGYLYPFTFYDFPVKEHVGRLGNSCLIVAHGVKDEIIPFNQGRAVFENYRGSSHAEFIDSSGAMHNNLLFNTGSRVAASVEQCLGANRTK